MRLGLLLFALTVLVPQIARAETPDTSRPRILYLQPLGACDRKQEGSESVRRGLLAFYDLEVRLLQCAELPAEAYHKPRHRYRAEKLLDFLRQRIPSDGWRILGLTATDISTSKDAYVDWGVLGLGELPGKASVISSFRCKKTARDPRHAIVRLAKVAVHEVGHTLGLPHCHPDGDPGRIPMPSREASRSARARAKPEVGEAGPAGSRRPTDSARDSACLMVDAAGKVATVDREHDFCARCRKLAASAGVPIKVLAGSPW